ncbi:MAG: hypothetical protein ACLFOC_08430 [Campylobacterales bacterium]
MYPSGERRPLSRTIAITSFGAAFFVATFFYYFSYRYSELRTIDFAQSEFYTLEHKKFDPSWEYFAIVIFSSKQKNLKSILKKVNKEYNVVLVDIDREFSETNEPYTVLNIGINSVLKLIWAFNIKEVPALIVLKKDDTNYKQYGRTNYFFKE